MTKMKMVEYYMQFAYQPEEIYRRFVETMPANLEIDTLVGVGLSGGLVVPTLARTLGMDWLVIRKQNDGSHSSEPAFGMLGHRWLFVDDCVSSGQTIARALAGVENTIYDNSFETEWVGTYLYQSDYFDPASYYLENPPWRLKEYLDAQKQQSVVLDDLTIHDDRENLKESGSVPKRRDDRFTIMLPGSGGGGGGGKYEASSLIRWPNPFEGTSSVYAKKVGDETTSWKAVGTLAEPFVTTALPDDIGCPCSACRDKYRR